MKKYFISAAAVAVVVLSFVIWASINGLTLIVVSASSGRLNSGMMYVSDQEKNMSYIRGRLWGGYTVSLDGAIYLRVNINARPRDIQFGYTTPGEFQINLVKLDPSGAFTVSHYTIP